MRSHLNANLITAIITPFTTEGAVDFEALERITEHLIQTGSDGIVVNGSTGENPTLTPSEKIAALRTVKQVIAGRPVKLIAGSGTNDTATTLELCRDNAHHGVDALLVVSPYYNKPSQAGLLAHFTAVAQAADAPVMIYNIPSRSMVNVEPQTLATLAERCDAIIGVKQSHPDMDQVSEIRRLAAPDFQLWCGDDSLALPMMALGACGVVSVAGHLTGRLIRNMVDAMKRNDLETARNLHLQQMPVFRGIFQLPNPTLVKACLAQMGLCTPTLRLPLVEPAETEMPLVQQLFDVIQVLNAGL